MAQKHDPQHPKPYRRQRQALQDHLHSIALKAEAERKQYSRQVSYDDSFDALSGDASPMGIRLLAPPYLPGKMYELYEQSGMLKACVESFVDNVDGYGYAVVSTVAQDDNLEKDDNPDLKLLKEFFDWPNHKESFTTIRTMIRRDIEVTGNGYLEIVRGRDDKPVLAFWADAKRVRLTVAREPVLCTVQVPRGSQWIDVQAAQRFRTFCMLSADGNASGPKARYFKEYGDPRPMDATTGRFGSKDHPVPQENRASEILHFKHGNDAYGIPRWIATLTSVLGSCKANLVNYDLFEHQGIPPLIITVAGGQLTDESYRDLLNLFRKAKGARNFHKLMVLEAESTGTSVDGKDAVPRLEVQNMAEYRKEDAMFLAYLEACRDDIQKLGFRLPGMFLGISDDANFATAFIVRQTAEEQLFIPERSRFDEIINKHIVRDLLAPDAELCFKSLGPTLHSVEDLPKVIELLVKSGVFTVNGLISFVNKQFGLRIALYEGQEWAELPINAAHLDQPGTTQDQRPAETDPDEEGESVAKNDLIYHALKDLEQVAKRYAVRDACRAA